MWTRTANLLILEIWTQQEIQGSWRDSYFSRNIPCLLASRGHTQRRSWSMMIQSPRSLMPRCFWPGGKLLCARVIAVHSYTRPMTIMTMVHHHLPKRQDLTRHLIGKVTTFTEGSMNQIQIGKNRPRFLSLLGNTQPHKKAVATILWSYPMLEKRYWESKSSPRRFL